MGQRDLVQPHAGRLVDRTGASKASVAPAVSITLTERQQCDLEMIAIGAMSPLEGFMGEGEYHSVCDNMMLADGTLWLFRREMLN